MKKLILNLEHDYVAFLMAVVGVLCISIPHYIINYVHIILSILLFLYILFALLGHQIYKDQQVNIGKIVIYFVLAIVLLLEKASDLHTLGVMWSMISLVIVSEEINEYFENKEFSFIRFFMIIISLSLAILLLTDPNHHFSSHIQILGIEIIASVFTRKHHLKSEG